MKKTDLIIFDCDGTLVDSEVVASDFFPRYWASHGLNMTPDEFKEGFIGVGNNSEIGRKTFAQMPPHAEEEGDRLYAEELKKKLKPVEGIVDLLSGLSGPICVASNSSLKHVEDSISRTGLSKFFGEHLYSAHQVDRPKPSPDLFLYVLEKHKVETKKAIVVEDSVAGITAAQKAGIPVIAFTGAGHFTENLKLRLQKAEPDWFCESISDLEKLLLERTN